MKLTQRRNLVAYLVVSLALLISGCAGPSIEHYADSEPQFDARQFFDGQLVAYGVVQRRDGSVSRRFTASIDARWEGSVGWLDEQFVFDDGEVQQRRWRLEALGDGRYQATANDVEGEGLAVSRGFAFRLDYQLGILYRDSPLVLDVEDWMWLVDENVLLNQSVLRKFGVRVGSILLTIVRL